MPPEKSPATRLLSSMIADRKWSLSGRGAPANESLTARTSQAARITPFMTGITRGPGDQILCQFVRAVAGYIGALHPLMYHQLPRCSRVTRWPLQLPDRFDNRLVCPASPFLNVATTLDRRAMEPVELMNLDLIASCPSCPLQGIQRCCPAMDMISSRRGYPRAISIRLVREEVFGTIDGVADSGMAKTTRVGRLVLKPWRRGPARWVLDTVTGGMRTTRRLQIEALPLDG